MRMQGSPIHASHVMRPSVRILLKPNPKIAATAAKTAVHVAWVDTALSPIDRLKIADPLLNRPNFRAESALYYALPHGFPENPRELNLMVERHCRPLQVRSCSWYEIVTRRVKYALPPSATTSDRPPSAISRGVRFPYHVAIGDTQPPSSTSSCDVHFTLLAAIYPELKGSSSEFHPLQLLSLLSQKGSIVGCAHRTDPH